MSCFLAFNYALSIRELPFNTAYLHCGRIAHTFVDWMFVLQVCGFEDSAVLLLQPVSDWQAVNTYVVYLSLLRRC